MDYELILPELSDHEDRTDPLANRIRKNYRHLRKWARRTRTDCFRIFDRDIPGQPLVIDYYAGRLSIQFYSRRSSETPADEVIARTEQSLHSVFGSALKECVWKHRVIRERTEQYDKNASAGESFIALEYGVPFLINIRDYLDTGLFLDHRETRRLIAAQASGKRLLNLFCYTASFTVHAALGGAKQSLSVDMSNTYVEWARRNFELNGIDAGRHVVLREDCIRFMREYRKELFDIIVIDPPTISRSKKMDGMFDINRDYRELCSRALSMLAPGGSIMFSTNSRTIDPDFTSLPVLADEITPNTIPDDFRDRKIHRAWLLRKQ
jgi:23S rRNA (cytosine1962-C5)-methyltransferase